MLGAMNETFNVTNRTNSYYDYNMSHFEKLEEIILPVLIGVGTISNGFTLAIFCRGKQKRLSVSIYMCAYCIGNLIALYFSFGLHFLTLVTDFPELENFNSVGCSLLKFIDSIVSFCSIWFVVGMTIDRYIATCHPSNATTLCTVFMAKVAVAIILIGLVVISVHAMWIYELDAYGRCNMFPPLNDLMTVHLHMWNILSATAFVYLPLVMLLILNILLTFGLCFQHGTSSNNRHDSVSTEYTKAVVGISVTSFALLFPITLHNILERSGGQISPQTIYTFAYMRRASIVDVLFICLLLSRSFRHEIRNIYQQIRDRKKHNVELNRMSNKALLNNDQTTTTTTEEDTLI